MILAHWLNGLITIPDTDVVIDDFGTRHEFESMITTDDPPIDISFEAYSSAVRFEYEGLDEREPINPHFARMFYPEAS
jgi:hypothetical protein